MKNVKHDHSHEHEEEHMHSHGHDHGHEHGEGGENRKPVIIKLIISSILFIVGLVCEHAFKLNNTVCLVIYLISFVIAGYSVVFEAVRGLFHGGLLDECFLMTVASVGAFFTGSYAEAAAVMILYNLGEFLQDLAVDKSRDSITDLIDVMPKTANLLKNGETVEVDASEVRAGDVVVIKAGGIIPVDGIILSGSTSVDTSALSGESMPVDVSVGDTVLSGSLNYSGEITVRAETEYSNSTAAKMKELIEGAHAKKAKTESFIKKFAKVYTPVVVICALLIAVIPSLFDHQWRQWIYRALTFLVVSCPCALVISVPLTFYAGIGASSKKGILVKGAEHLETLSKVKLFAFDKTGTLTKGEFSVSDIVPASDRNELINAACNAEAHSDHPIAKALSALDHKKSEASDISEIPGEGVTCIIDGQSVAAGNGKLMKRHGIETQLSAKTRVHVCKNEVYLGYIEVSDTVKDNAALAISELYGCGVRKAYMLTGDVREAAEGVASRCGISEVRSELLPSQKVEQLELLINEDKTAYVGDGINDSAVLARADVGISMGRLGSDAAIEAADVVITDDNLSKLPQALKISKKTVRIAWENIIFALAVKAVVLILSIIGISSMMWLAVFADTGVALLCAANAMRAMK